MYGYSTFLQNQDPPLSSWTWEQVLNDFPRKEGEYPGAAPVSAFQLQNAPLSLYWDRISFKGTVGELELNSYLHNYLPHEKKQENGVEPEPQLSRRGRNSTRDDIRARKEVKKEQPLYWFVEAIEFEGYIVKVRFLGFPSELEDAERWIHYNQMQELGYYKRKNGICTPPQIDEYASLNPEEFSQDRLYQKMLACKFTIHPLRSGWMKQAEELIRWRNGSRVEVRNRDYCNEMLPAFIFKTRGHRVEIRYMNVPGSKLKDFEVHQDSDLIKSQGWTKFAGGKLSTVVKNYNPPALEPSKLGVGTDTEMNGNTQIEIKVGMLFEFINPVKLDEIALGKVTKVLSHGFFNCRIESSISGSDLKSHANGVNEFHYHITSDQLFPLGSFTDETPGPRPATEDISGNNVAGFNFEEYLQRTGTVALPLPPKTEESIACELEEYMWVEAADSHRPELVCPAIILKIVHPYAMKIQFLGWNNNKDQWKPIKSLDIFPIGWCQLSNHKFEPPKNAVLDLPARVKKPPSPIPIPIITTEIAPAESENEEDMPAKRRGRSDSEKSDIPVPIKNPSSLIFAPSLRKRAKSHKVEPTPSPMLQVEVSVKERLRAEWKRQQDAVDSINESKVQNSKVNDVVEKRRATPIRPRVVKSKKNAVSTSTPTPMPSANKKGKRNTNNKGKAAASKKKKARVISSSESES